MTSFGPFLNILLNILSYATKVSMDLTLQYAIPFLCYSELVLDGSVHLGSYVSNVQQRFNIPNNKTNASRMTVSGMSTKGS
jgi:hypothetical protein